MDKTQLKKLDEAIAIFKRMVKFSQGDEMLESQLERSKYSYDRYKKDEADLTRMLKKHEITVLI